MKTNSEKRQGSIMIPLRRGSTHLPAGRRIWAGAVKERREQSINEWESEGGGSQKFPLALPLVSFSLCAMTHTHSEPDLQAG